MKRVLAAGVAFMAAACATTPDQAWTVMRESDPITGASRCVVIAPDRGFVGYSTRTLALYPFVESNSEVGLLVGVTSGGSVRIPPGDILWRIDENPHRTIAANETPVIGGQSSWADNAALTADQRAALAASEAAMAGYMSSVRNGVTAAGGEIASEMLTEMKAGSSLIFRQAAAAPSAGAASVRSMMVGQITAEGLAPYPLDASFHASLNDCGL